MGLRLGLMSVERNRRNYYRILHVQPDAPGAVLKSSYRSLMLSLEMHPDRGGEHWNAALINEAHGVLSDPAKRAEYDRTLDLARIRSGRPADVVARSSRPEPESARDGAEHLCCLFCGAERAVTGPVSATAVCLDCRSPLTPAGAPQLEASGRRAARRVARDGDISYYVDWPQSTPDPGRIVDVSPAGVQFETNAPIGIFQIIKMEGSLLDAVGRVATCRERDGSFAIGVQFYTVRFHQRRGTFLSTSA